MKKKEKFDPVVEKAYLKDVVDWLKDLKILIKDGKDVEEINKNFVNIGDFILHCGESKINLFREGMDGIEKEESEKMSHRKNNIKCVISDIVIGKIVKMMSGEMIGKSSPSEKMRKMNCFTKSNLQQCLRRNKSVENFVLKYQIKNFIDEIIETMISDNMIIKKRRETDKRFGDVYKVNFDLCGKNNFSMRQPKNGQSFKERWQAHLHCAGVNINLFENGFEIREIREKKDMIRSLNETEIKTKLIEDAILEYTYKRIRGNTSDKKWPTIGLRPNLCFTKIEIFQALRKSKKIINFINNNYGKISRRDALEHLFMFMIGEKMIFKPIEENGPGERHKGMYKVDPRIFAKCKKKAKD